MEDAVRTEQGELIEREQPIEPVEIDSVTLARLLEEVRNGDAPQPTAYNRLHNRHNRS